MTMANGSDAPCEMPTLLAIPPRQTNPTECAPALLRYIETSYAEDATKYQTDGQTLDKMRRACLEDQTPELVTLERFFAYYSQVVFVCSRFPYDIGLDFAWHPVFQSNSKPVALSNLNYEKACVLFNIGALYTQLGCNESRISTEGIRKSCNFFQNAAGCLKYIEKEVLSDFRAIPPIDLCADAMQALIALTLAQAQECVWQKAVMEHMKHGTIARLAIKVADFYQAVQTHDISFFPSGWKRHVQIKAAYFNAVAQYHKANECISQGRYGEEIGRLRLAEKHNRKALDAIAAASGSGLFAMRAAASSSSSIMQESFAGEVRKLEESIERDLIRAERDNDLVYMEPVPEASQLAPLLRSDMVRPLVPPEIVDPTHWKRKPSEDIQRPLFESLVPFAVHQAASVYSDKKEYVVKNDIVGRCNELEEEMKLLFEKLQLPRCIDTVDPDTIPGTLIACAEEVQHEGGGQALRDMLNKVQEMSIKNMDLVDEGFNVLEEENEQDEIFRRQYGNLWSRPSSQQLTAALLSQGSKYHDTLQAAQKADRIVRAKVSNWGKAIDMLSHPTSDIIGHLPSLRNDDSLEFSQLTELMRRLRAILQECDDAATRRKRAMDEACSLSAADDIADALLAKATELTGGFPTVKIEPAQFNEVFAVELKKYDGLQSVVQELYNNQIRQISRLKELHEQFQLVVRASTLAAKREKAIQNLEQAFVKFKEIRSNMVEGIKFYSQYVDTLSHFRDACVDFALARRLEASELARDTPLKRG
ncbi:BRO1-like domain-containing protein [Zychaea mexicana]|uniref:BRO1-like domain-containing protein n=1 Tax=Zychaea mexicana TaxID=64656 RepID=UPI0022FE5129|nr:BRO1-like domain-containing protein [Zychaea mexicana]KAI9492476.1 BRO1-like domain-containing protein [Zychaea mexicana]